MGATAPTCLCLGPPLTLGVLSLLHRRKKVTSCGGGTILGVICKPEGWSLDFVSHQHPEIVQVYITHELMQACMHAQNSWIIGRLKILAFILLQNSTDSSFINALSSASMEFSAAIFPLYIGKKKRPNSSCTADDTTNTCILCDLIRRSIEVKFNVVRWRWQPDISWEGPQNPGDREDV